MKRRNNEQLIAGRRPVLEALRGRRPVKKLLLARGVRGRVIDDLLTEAERRQVPIEWVDRSELTEQVAPIDNDQGVAAVVAPIALVELEDLLSAGHGRDHVPALLVCAEIQDPHNLGALIRTAACAGFDGAILPRHRTAGLTPAVAKASAGAIEHLPLAQVTNLSRSLQQMKAAGLWIFAADPSAQTTYWEADLTGPVALVVGSEGRGIPPLVRRQCDVGVSIPLSGPVESLNAAVAGALLMFEVVRQRRAKGVH